MPDDTVSKRIPVVGVKFEGRQEVLRTLLESGGKLSGCLVREPENRFDSNAVAVHVNGKRIGYIPKGRAETIAAQIDAGRRFEMAELTVFYSKNHDTYGADFKLVRKGEEDVQST